MLWTSAHAQKCDDSLVVVSLSLLWTLLSSVLTTMWDGSFWITTALETTILSYSLVTASGCASLQNSLFLSVALHTFLVHAPAFLRFVLWSLSFCFSDSLSLSLCLSISRSIRHLIHFGSKLFTDLSPPQMMIFLFQWPRNYVLQWSRTLSRLSNRRCTGPFV